jgi:hypothetical protein
LEQVKITQEGVNASYHTSRKFKPSFTLTCRGFGTDTGTRWGIPLNQLNKKRRGLELLPIFKLSMNKLHECFVECRPLPSETVEFSVAYNIEKIPQNILAAFSVFIWCVTAGQITIPQCLIPKAREIAESFLSKFMTGNLRRLQDRCAIIYSSGSFNSYERIITPQEAQAIQML